MDGASGGPRHGPAMAKAAWSTKAPYRPAGWYGVGLPRTANTCADHGGSGEILLVSRLGAPAPELRAPLAEYLLGCTSLMAAGNIDDPMDPAKTGAVPFGLSTDGTWDRPTYWGYFVREYGVTPPEEFITHAHAAGFSPVELSEDEYGRAVTELSEQYPQEGDIVYYAMFQGNFSRSNPSGVVRRRTVNGQTYDEAFTRDLRWEPTEYPRRYALGHDDVDHAEITPAEASAFVVTIAKKLSGRNRS